MSLTVRLCLAAIVASAIWVLCAQLDTAQAEQQLAIERAEQSEQLASHHQANAERLARQLETERDAQQQLRTTQDQLRAILARRLQQIEDLKRENQELRDWADQPLPAAARRLRGRPAITGADGYRDWLSRRDAMQPAASDAGQ